MIRNQTKKNKSRKGGNSQAKYGLGKKFKAKINGDQIIQMIKMAKMTKMDYPKTKQKHKTITQPQKREESLKNPRLQLYNKNRHK